MPEMVYLNFNITQQGTVMFLTKGLNFVLYICPFEYLEPKLVISFPQNFMPEQIVPSTKGKVVEITNV
jgi:hypothetical protein